MTIAAELEDGNTLIGQCNISHPVRLLTTSAHDFKLLSCSDGMDETIPTQRQNVNFKRETENAYESLTSRIHRIYYINGHGQEVHPVANATYLARLRTCGAILYSIGSLWTRFDVFAVYRPCADIVRFLQYYAMFSFERQ